MVRTSVLLTVGLHFIVLSSDEENWRVEGTASRVK
jgi:hypothetical protein